MPAVGRKLHWFLSPADATPASIERLLRETDDLGAPGEPVLSILDWVPGLAPERWRQWLERRGWQLITRVDLFFPAAASIPTFVPPTGAAIRSATHADRGELVDLMESAYSADLRERALFMVSRDRRVDAERGIAELLDGTLGEWVASASFVARFEGRLAGAILVNLFHGPLITQVMVEPAFRRSGVASALLTGSIAAVRAKGLGVPRLVVTDSNLPAVWGLPPVRVHRGPWDPRGSVARSPRARRGRRTRPVVTGPFPRPKVRLARTTLLTGGAR